MAETVFEFKVSVRTLAETVSGGGDIDAGSFSFANRLREGSEIHRQIQSTYKAEDVKEAYLAGTYESSGVRLVISGRADGILETQAGTVIEEIKSTELHAAAIEGALPAHLSQAKIYAYLYCVREELLGMDLRVRYYSIPDKRSVFFDFSFSFDELKSHFVLLCEKLCKLVSAKRTRTLRRQSSIQQMDFPYPYRKYQRQIIASVAKAIQENKNLFLTSPTGSGKTLNALFAALQCLDENLEGKIVYLTAKTTQRLPAQETVRMLEGCGLDCLSVSITAKEKCCFLGEPACNPIECEYARGYYEKMDSALVEAILGEGCLDMGGVAALAEKHMLCPFELALDIARWADIVICDYNYFFDPFVRLTMFSERKAPHILLVDEAHNLIDRSRSMYTAALQRKWISDAKRTLKKGSEAMRDLNRISRTFREAAKQPGDETALLRLANALRQFANGLASNAEAVNEENAEVMTELYRYVRRFLRIYEMRNDSYFLLYSQPSGVMELFCADARSFLQESLKWPRSAIFFSATMAPLPFYCERLGGAKDDYLLSAPPIFPAENFPIIADMSISTEYKRREAFYSAIADRIHFAAQTLPGNTMAFFPSYAFMNAILNEFAQSYPSDEILIAPRSANEEERLAFIGNFSESSHVTAFAVAGGVFSEALDMKGDKLSNVIVCGVSIPMVSDEQEAVRSYFASQGKDGFAYAYIYSGMNKVLQAMGRAIRSEEDKGTAILLDSRFGYGEYKNILTSIYAQSKFVKNAGELKAALTQITAIGKPSPS